MLLSIRCQLCYTKYEDREPFITSSVQVGHFLIFLYFHRFPIFKNNFIIQNEKKMCRIRHNGGHLIRCKLTFIFIVMNQITGKRSASSSPTSTFIICFCWSWLLESSYSFSHSQSQKQYHEHPNLHHTVSPQLQKQSNGQHQELESLQRPDISCRWRCVQEGVTSHICRWTMGRLYFGNCLVDCWPMFNEVETAFTLISSMAGGKNSITKVNSPTGSLKMFYPSLDENSLLESFPVLKMEGFLFTSWGDRWSYFRSVTHQHLPWCIGKHLLSSWAADMGLIYLFY